MASAQQSAETGRVSYAEKLRDPRWQKLRLRIFERDEWTCCGCRAKDRTLNVHHVYYLPDYDPWDYPDESLRTLCEACHHAEPATRETYLQDLLDSLDREGFLSGEISTLIAIVRSAGARPGVFMRRLYRAARFLPEPGLPPEEPES